MDFPLYKQPDAKDCGPTCLGIIAQHYGKLISLTEIRKLSETTRAGNNLMKLSDAAEAIGFKSLGHRRYSLWQGHFLGRDLGTFGDSPISKNFSSTMISRVAQKALYLCARNQGGLRSGLSNKPGYRERTLQSEKPTIEMIASKKFPIRKIAESIEKLYTTLIPKKNQEENGSNWT